MKKTLLICILAALLLIAACTGCAKTIEEKIADEITEGLEDMAEGLEDIAEGAADDAAENIAEDIKDAAEDAQDASDSAATGNTPAAAYDRFITAKNAAYDSITENMEDDADLSMTAGLELLTLAMIDLQTIDLTFVTDDIAASEAAAALIGLSEMKIDFGGENFGVQFKGAEGAAFASTGKYDAGSDSLTCVWTKDGSETLMMEFAGFGEGFAGQYFVTGENGTSVIKVIADGENVVIGMSETDARPASIYKAAPADFSFADDCTTVISVIGGQGTYIKDGEEKQF